MTFKKLQEKLKLYSEPVLAKHHAKFFKTEKGGYGEGDKFIGIRVPNIRKVVKEFYDLDLNEIKKIISSYVHEHRFAGLIILIQKFEKNKNNQKQIFDFYLENFNYINNWDLIDVSSHKIIGAYVYNYPRYSRILDKFVLSKNLWEKRLSIVSTWALIKKGKFDLTLKYSKILIKDSHHLTHKAVGWMLREVWKRDSNLVENFLIENYSNIPRTTLRYSIERMENKKRKRFLKGYP